MNICYGRLTDPSSRIGRHLRLGRGCIISSAYNLSWFAMVRVTLDTLSGRDIIQTLPNAVIFSALDSICKALSTTVGHLTEAAYIQWWLIALPTGLL